MSLTSRIDESASVGAMLPIAQPDQVLKKKPELSNATIDTDFDALDLNIPEENEPEAIEIEEPIEVPEKETIPPTMFTEDIEKLSRHLGIGTGPTYENGETVVSFNIEENAPYMEGFLSEPDLVPLHYNVKRYHAVLHTFLEDLINRVRFSKQDISKAIIEVKEGINGPYLEGNFFGMLAVKYVLEFEYKEDCIINKFSGFSAFFTVLLFKGYLFQFYFDEDVSYNDSTMVSSNGDVILKQEREKGNRRFLTRLLFAPDARTNYTIDELLSFMKDPCFKEKTEFRTYENGIVFRQFGARRKLHGTNYFKKPNRIYKNIQGTVVEFYEVPSFNESGDTLFLETVKIDKDIQDVIATLNEKGYKTKYSCSGHPSGKVKEDRYKDGVLNNKLYSTARVIFATTYDFPNIPKNWKKKTLDANKPGEEKTAIYVKPPHFNMTKGLPEDQFNNWKKRYMYSLRTWAESLPEEGETAPKITLESVMDDLLLDAFHF